MFRCFRCALLWEAGLKLKRVTPSGGPYKKAPLPHTQANTSEPRVRTARVDAQDHGRPVAVATGQCQVEGGLLPALANFLRNLPLVVASRSWTYIVLVNSRLQLQKPCIYIYIYLYVYIYMCVYTVYIPGIYSVYTCI